MQIAALPLEHQFTVIGQVPHDDVTTLARLALVSLAWRREAERWLYRSATLTTEQQTIKYFDALAKRDYERCRYVRCIRVDPWQWQDDSSIETRSLCRNTISRCTRLEVFRVSSSFPLIVEDDDTPCLFPHLKNVELTGVLGFIASPSIQKLFEHNPSIMYTRVIYSSSTMHMLRNDWRTLTHCCIRQIQSDAPSLLSWGDTPISVERLILGARSFVQLLILGDRLVNIVQAELVWPLPDSVQVGELINFQRLVNNPSSRRKLREIRNMKSLRTIIVYLPEVSSSTTWLETAGIIADIFLVFPCLVNLVITGPAIGSEVTRKQIVGSEEFLRAEKKLAVDFVRWCPELRRVTLAPVLREWTADTGVYWDITAHHYAESIDDPEWACYRELEKY